MHASSPTRTEVHENSSFIHPIFPHPLTPQALPKSPLSSSREGASPLDYLPSPPNSEISGHDTEAPSFRAPPPSSTPPEDFIQGLLNHDLRSETIFIILEDGDFDGEVCVLRDRDTLYTMVPTFGGLDHDHLASDKDQDSGTSFCRLDFKRKNSKAEYSVEYKGTTCYYVRLGWLVLQDVPTKSRVTTNYVLLLNVTTEPASLWLAFDYLGSDAKGDDRLRELGDDYNDSEYYAWYQNRPNILDYESRSSRVETSTHNLRSLRKNDGGYLGVQKPFDLAMMSEDIKKDWKGRVSSGLDSEKVLKCMNETGKVLGESLRALPRMPTWSTG